MSDIAEVNYNRCNECGHVWTADKITQAQIRHVTPFEPPDLPRKSNSD